GSVDLFVYGVRTGAHFSVLSGQLACGWTSHFIGGPEMWPYAGAVSVAIAGGLFGAVLGVILPHDSASPLSWFTGIARAVWGAVVGVAGALTKLNPGQANRIEDAPNTRGSHTPPAGPMESGTDAKDTRFVRS